MVQVLRPVQSRFTTGELTPRLHAAFDAELYKTSVAELTNFVTRPQGTVYRRGGFEFIHELPNTAEGRLVEFQLSATQSFMILFTPEECYPLTPSGYFEAQNKVQNPGFVLGNTHWTAVEAGGGTVAFDVANTLCELRVGDDPASVAGIQQAVTVTASTSYVIRSKLQAALLGTTYTLYVGTTAGASDVASFEASQAALQCVVDSGSNTTLHLTFKIAGEPGTTALLDSLDMYPGPGGSIGTPIDSPYLSGELANIQAVMSPQGATMYLVHPAHTPYKLTYDTDTSEWDLSPVAFIAAPAAWVTGNYPATLTFFQGRSWWGGAPNEPSTFYGSKSGLYEDLTAGSLADDGLEFTLSHRGAIRWMSGVKSLLIGTEVGEFIVTAENGLIKPGDISVEQQSAFGSMSRQSIAVGNHVSYISADQRRARIMGYQWDANAWLSVDLTFTAEHISSQLFRACTYTKAPESVFWFIDSVGRLIGCSYEPSLKLLGWHKHSAWQPFIDVAVENSRGKSTLWALRRVDRATGAAIVLERATDTNYMDSCVARFYPEAITVIPDLWHLEGQTVQVLVDGATQPDRVVANGQITLQTPGRYVVVGVGYTSRLETLPIEAGLQSGASLPMTKRWNKIFARVINSAKPLIQGQRPPDRTPSTPMDSVEPVVITEDVKVINLGWSQRFTVTIEQELPFAYEMLAIFGEAAFGAMS